MLPEGWPRAATWASAAAKKGQASAMEAAIWLEPHAGRTPRSLPKTTSGWPIGIQGRPGPALAKPATELVEEPTPAPEFLIRTINRKKTA
jgi:hypothetical protein